MIYQNFFWGFFFLFYTIKVALLQITSFALPPARPRAGRIAKAPVSSWQCARRGASSPRGPWYDGPQPDRRASLLSPSRPSSCG